MWLYIITVVSLLLVLAIGSYLSKNQEQAFNNFEFEIKRKKKQK